MKMTNKQIKLLPTLLELNREIVGIKFIDSANQWNDIKAKELLRPANYCQIVAAASNGHSIKMKNEDIKCRSAAISLGFEKNDLKNKSGENWTRLGLYDNPDISKELRDRIPDIKKEYYGIKLAPLKDFEEVPDVIIIVTNPYNIMRIVQGYSYYFGQIENVSIAGNQGICRECTVEPMNTKGINISTLCIGTRHRTGWKDDEMAVGISGNIFEKVVSGVANTINSMESDKKKKAIEKRAKEYGINIPNIKWNYNYYMDC
ncbi:MAG: DUF169 domain-containing protein [Lachnospiraceae bacterium]|jgi:uncharacterized protein (DUF169 family)|nr:DUF169 domain-containing protein [Lachnospiraceae bacterium]